MTEQPISQAALEALCEQYHTNINFLNLDGLSQDAKDRVFSYFMHEQFKKEDDSVKRTKNGQYSDMYFRLLAGTIRYAYLKGISTPVVKEIALEALPRACDTSYVHFSIACGETRRMLQDESIPNQKKEELTSLMGTLIEKLKEHYLQQGRPEKAVLALSAAHWIFGTNGDSLVNLLEEQKLNAPGVLALCSKYDIMGWTFKHGVTDVYRGIADASRTNSSIGLAYQRSSNCDKAIEFLLPVKNKELLKEVYDSNTEVFDGLFTKHLDKIWKTQPGVLPELSLEEAIEISKMCGQVGKDIILERVQRENLDELVVKYKDDELWGRWRNWSTKKYSVDSPFFEERILNHIYFMLSGLRREYKNPFTGQLEHNKLNVPEELKRWIDKVDGKIGAKDIYLLPGALGTIGTCLIAAGFYTMANHDSLTANLSPDLAGWLDLFPMISVSVGLVLDGIVGWMFLGSDERYTKKSVINWIEELKAEGRIPNLVQAELEEEYEEPMPEEPKEELPEEEPLEEPKEEEEV